jgi:hypothetical protein
MMCVLFICILLDAKICCFIGHCLPLSLKLLALKKKHTCMVKTFDDISRKTEQMICNKQGNSTVCSMDRYGCCVIL